MTRITGEILQPIRASKPTLWKVSICSILNQPRSSGLLVERRVNLSNRIALRCDASFKFLTYQLPIVGYWLTMAMTGNSEFGFSSGEGA